jgi:hypothetical protein
VVTVEQFEAVKRGCEWVIQAIIRRAYPLESTSFDGQAEHWQSVRDELVDLRLDGFFKNQTRLEFLRSFLNVVTKLLKEGLQTLGNFDCEGHYPIKPDSWAALRQESPQLGLTAHKSSWSDDAILVAGPLAEFISAFESARKSLIDALPKATAPQTPVERLFVVEVPTYGIYVPRTARSVDESLKRWAYDRQIPVELTLPTTPRVLFCVGAQQQLEEQLRRESIGLREASQLAREFQRCVLIHEHFHAALETGFDQDQTTESMPIQSITAASNLNEALAAWMELHSARTNSKLANLIWNYIRAGEYPTWPYRGAEHVENLFQQNGLTAVHDLIVRLRKDPISTQTLFDSTIS